MSRGKAIGILIALIVVVAIVVVLGLQLYNQLGIGKPQVNLTAQNAHIDYTCSLCPHYFGPTLQGGGNSLSVSGGSQFTETVTPKNQDCCSSHQVSSASILTPGFTLISITPSLPITLGPGDSISITINIQAPNSAYTGPLDYQITTS